MVASAPPFESVADGGLQFAYSPYEIVKANQDFVLHLHVINDTATLTNATTSCLLHLYKPNGEHLLESDMGWDSNDLEFKLDIDAGNFTLGQHAYIIICNNTNKQIREVSGIFNVNNIGEEFTQPISIWYIGVTALLCFLFVICIGGIGMLPTEDSRDEEGKLISINNLKYIKYPLGMLAWGMLAIISYLMWNVSEAYLTNVLTLGIFKMFFTILMTSATIGIPIIFYFMFAKFMQDIVIKRMIERNIM